MGGLFPFQSRWEVRYSCKIQSWEKMRSSKLQSQILTPCNEILFVFNPIITYLFHPFSFMLSGLGWINSKYFDWQSTAHCLPNTVSTVLDMIVSMATGYNHRHHNQSHVKLVLVIKIKFFKDSEWRRQFMWKHNEESFALHRCPRSTLCKPSRAFPHTLRIDGC